MPTYVLFGTYTPESLKAISADRTDRARALIQKYHGEYKAGYALLGEIDLLVVLDLPDTEHAMQTSAALSRVLDIRFRMAPAVEIGEFDRLMA